MINVNPLAKQNFNNNVDFCVGTGRMGLALTKEYFDQLEIVQKEIGFKFIRGHGLFCDDMGIYQEFEGKTEYNFTYLDRVVDSYLKLNIRPFLELGFMPEKLASGTQTVFYWKGNVTPPADYSKWTAMVEATLIHLMDRYGKEEVLTWPIEVWNEPNLTGFWKDADIDEYYKLYEITSAAIKKIDKRFKVGGPAICGGADEKWMKGFLTYCHQHQLPLDFISRHHYCTELPKSEGHYGYPKMMDLDYTLQTLKDCRKIIDSFDEYKNLPFNITEFNTSYIPNCPVHDTNMNAAYIARTLAELGDYVTSYSYWTFGDVFEEKGIPFSLFHGGFGMLANGGIPKPTYWTFKFFKDLKEKEEACVYRDKNLVIVKTKDGNYKGIFWNLSIETKKDNLSETISIPAWVKDEKRYCLITKTVDEDCCNPLKIWHDLGEKTNPSLSEIELIKSSANPLIKSIIIEENNQKVDFTLNASRHGVIYFELNPAPLKTDRGYNYNFDYGRN